MSSLTRLEYRTSAGTPTAHQRHDALAVVEPRRVGRSAAAVRRRAEVSYCAIPEGDVYSMAY